MTNQIKIQYQDQSGKWQHFLSMHNETYAYKTAKPRAKNTGKRHRLVSAEGQLLDLIDP